ncbi:hypothetical protein [Thermocrinis minervae]|uniref:Uncharacterized protein n=1 Tax=Thermocrinis minervae TaxID=381751 RepID=A0A1M6QV69_9AQUI|nr:hypothetical protein [Thermocrinis minervae]SHK24096.1 hypothetical protein SAMN05444391_0409 [Thermocrinis minervae]
MLAEIIYKLMLYGFLMVLFAGSYALMYSFGRSSSSSFLVKLSYIFAFLEFLAGFGMVSMDYLHTFWKVIILFSSVAYLFIPPLMWKVVVLFHKRHG